MGKQESRAIKSSITGKSNIFAVYTDETDCINLLMGSLSGQCPVILRCHVILHENMSSLNTQQILDLFGKLLMPFIFSAPASYKAVPEESVFMNLKLTHFRQRQLYPAF